MQLISLYIEKFKNLKNFTIDFEKQENLSIIIGNNGSGKSNILEALSAIFAELYGNKNIVESAYKLKYKIDEKEVIIEKTSIVIEVMEDRTPLFITNYKIDNVVKNKNFLKTSTLLPSRIVALYSGEETRLYTHYYERFTKLYLRDFTKILNPSNSMIFIDKIYWNSALLSFILSSYQNNEDHKKFINETLKIKTIHNVNIEFNSLYFSKIIYNSPLDILINIINPNKQPVMSYSSEAFFDLIIHYDATDLFNILIHASLLQRAKIIKNISFTFNDEKLNFSALSEGEKKKLLIKAVMDLVGNEKSLILLDEPDSHIHVEGKQEIFNLLKEYASIFNRSIVITTHSPTLTNCADEKHVVMLTKNEDGSSCIVTDEKKELIRKLTGGIWTSVEQNIFINSTKPLILVEGVDDTTYIRKAIKYFNDDYNLEVDLLYFGGTTNACEFIKNLNQMGLADSKKIITIFDRDKAGFEGLRDCIKEFRVSESINLGAIGSNDNNIYYKNSFFYFLYPKTDECINSSEFVLEDYFSKKTKARYIKKKIKSNPLDLRNFNGLGDKIKKDIRLNINNIPKSEMENFKVLLDKIKEVIEGGNTNFIEID